MKTRNKVLIGGAVIVIAYLLMNRDKKKANVTATESGSGSGSANAPSQSSNLELPSNMDLPNLTPSTNVPTEVAIKSSIDVVPTPAIAEPKPASTEDVLAKGLIIPIPKVTVTIAQPQTEPIVEAPVAPVVEVPSVPQLAQVFTPDLPKVAPSIAPTLEVPQEVPYSTRVKQEIYQAPNQQNVYSGNESATTLAYY